MAQTRTRPRCLVCATGRTALHSECLLAAQSWLAAGRFDTEPSRRLLVRMVADCYLCGTTDRPRGGWDMEHRYPRSRGGSDTWPNVALACVPCNRHVKGPRMVTLDADQEARWQRHQHAVRSAYDRVNRSADRLGRHSLVNVMPDLDLYDADADDLDPAELAQRVAERWTEYLQDRLDDADDEYPADELAADLAEEHPYQLDAAGGAVRLTYLPSGLVVSVPADELARNLRRAWWNDDSDVLGDRWR